MVKLHPVPTCHKCIIIFIPVMMKVWIDYKFQTDKHTLNNLEVKKSVTFNFNVLLMVPLSIERCYRNKSWDM
jgi:hypothetical protein